VALLTDRGPREEDHSVMHVGRLALLAAGGVSLLALAASGPVGAANGPDWVGTITAAYTASGSVDNANCSGCTSTSKESAKVTETITATGTKIAGTVSLVETNTFNSQCTGTVTRVERDHGTLARHSQGGVPVQAYGGSQNTIGFNPPGIPYKGTLKDEQVSTATGQKTCTAATRPSSGVFYIPGIGGPLIGKGNPDKTQTVSGSVSSSKVSCGVPRTSCTVTITWNLTRANCDPDALSRGERELATAKSFLDAGKQELVQRQQEMKEFAVDYGKESVEIGAEKLTLLKVLETISHDAAEAAEVTGIYVGIGATVEEISLKLVPLLADQHHLDKEALADFQRAADWTARAKADLQKASSQGPCIENLQAQLDKALGQQKLEDDAHTLIDSWDHGQAVYRDPATGEVLDERAALARARQILASGRHTQSERAKIMATRKQIDDAVAQIGNAQADHAHAKRLADAYARLVDQTVSRLSALLG
jgi:hypothetical protein